jgi:hypothetical protein
MKSFKLLFAFFMILISYGIKAFRHHHHCFHQTLHHSHVIHHVHYPLHNCYHHNHHHHVGHKTVHGHMTNVSPSSNSIITPEIGKFIIIISS